jgi:rhodanese-related sulfurtransferase
MSFPASISSDKLSRLNGTANAPTLIDVRIDEDFAADPRRIPGATHRSHRDIDDWAPSFNGQSAIVICHKGEKLSEGAAAWLRHNGIAAETLEGGQVGWKNAELPTVPADKFGLSTPPLERLGTMVRAADTGRLDLSPEAPGLLAASLGLSRMFDDDLEQLSAGMPLYDAFYRWCRDATKETHNWPTNKVKP